MALSVLWFVVRFVCVGESLVEFDRTRLARSVLRAAVKEADFVLNSRKMARSVDAVAPHTTVLHRPCFFGLRLHAWAEP